MKIEIKPVAYVKNERAEAVDDNWGDILSEILLADNIPADSLTGLLEFSHIEVIYFFDKAEEDDINFIRHPRGNTKWPLTGIFAQRAKDRPNRMGLTTVEVIKVVGRSVMVKGLDAINGTPIIDIKPVMREFLPNGEIKQPEWSKELMKNYWQS